MGRVGWWLAALSVGATTAPVAVAQAAWSHREFEAPGNPPLPAVEAFLAECAPSGLDGIQLVAVQRGHEDKLHLHVYCRADHAAGVSYRVTLPSAPKGKALGLVMPLAARPNVKIGPFHFGEAGGDDGIVVVEKVG